jgi:hypothetical protein
MATEEVRRCRICSHDLTGRHGHTRYCSTLCRREAERERRAANREKLNERARRYRAANREEITERNRRYRADPEKYRARRRRYRAANREKINEQQRCHRAANAERYREQRRRRYLANWEKIREQKHRRDWINKAQIAALEAVFYPEGLPAASDTERRRFRSELLKVAREMGFVDLEHEQPATE